MSETEEAVREAPFEAVEACIGDTITVQLKTEQRIHGTLDSYDEHLNLVLNTSDGPTATDQQDDTTGDGRLVIRGGAVVSITEPPTHGEGLTTLENRLTDQGLDVQRDETAPALIITKLGHEYRVRPDGTIDGDGPHAQQIKHIATDEDSEPSGEPAE